MYIQVRENKPKKLDKFENRLDTARHNLVMCVKRKIVNLLWILSVRIKFIKLGYFE